MNWQSKRYRTAQTDGIPRALSQGISTVESRSAAELFDNISLNSILRKLKRPSFGLTLFLIGFQGMYLVPLYFPYAHYDPAPSAAFRYYYISWLLVCAGGALETLKGGMRHIRSKRLWASTLLAALAIITTISVVEGETILSISIKCMPFYWLLLVPAIGSRAENWPWLWLSFFLQAPVGIAYSLNAFLIRGATTRLTMQQMPGQNFLALCLYMAPFMFLMWAVFRDKALKGFVLYLFSLENLRLFFLANRYTAFILPIEILMVVYVHSRSQGTLPTFQRFFGKGLLIALLIVPVALAVAQSRIVSKLAPTFGQAYEDLIQRMGEGSVQDTITFDNRWLELKVVSDSMDPMDWILGKGLAARWSDPFYADWEERYMVHNTWLNSFYWGGVFLFLAISWPFVWTIRLVSRSHSKAGMCGAMYILAMYLKFPAYLITMVTQEWLLFCLALGIVFCSEPSTIPGKRPNRL